MKSKVLVLLLSMLAGVLSYKQNPMNIVTIPVLVYYLNKLYITFKEEH